MALSGQLVRQDANGVAGLLSATFGEDASASEAPLEKLEATSRLLLKARDVDSTTEIL